MDTQVDDNAIDLRDLQAQIDLSMAFAQNLVTSWVTPTGYTQTNRQKELEDEIKEYMRRPARLGVGAPIPEAQSLAREAARLKSKLGGGTKRPREDQSMGVKNFGSDDEEESRTGAIKKKARIDPFSVPSKNKKKDIRDNEKTESTMYHASMKVMPQDQLLLAEDEIEIGGTAKELLAIQDTSGNKKETKPKLPVDQYHGEEEETKRTKTILLSDVKITPLPTGKLLAASKFPRLSEPSTQGTFKSSTLPSAVPRVPRGNLVDVSSAPNPLLSSGDRVASTNFLQQPLLNLRGSPCEPESDNGSAGPSGLTPKKKRKRRKKRKSQQSTEILPSKT